MSALLSPLEEIDPVSLNPRDNCRFCNCTDEAPCRIPLREDDGKFFLAYNDARKFLIVACSWFIPGVCSSPLCIEKLLAESRDSKIVLFDAEGRKVG
jgi:hypothetical protein